LSFCLSAWRRKFMAICRTVTMFRGPGTGSQTAEILVEHDVQHPVQAVLGVPMAAHGVREQFGVECQGGQIEASFQADAAVAFDLASTTAMARNNV
jgi:hypothetical protein